MELAKDKSKSAEWFGAHRDWQLRTGFPRMAQRKRGVWMGSQAGRPRRPAG